MSLYQIRTFGDPVLREKALPVEKIDNEIMPLVSEMTKIMRAHDGVGLAANQIGVLKKVIVVSFEDEDIAFINPRITWKSADTQISEEGCLSLPGVCAPVERAMGIKVEALDLSGNKLEIEAEELLARIFQHEIDHVEGRVLFDHLDREARKAAFKSLNDYLIASGSQAG